MPTGFSVAHVCIEENGANRTWRGRNGRCGLPAPNMIPVGRGIMAGPKVDLEASLPYPGITSTTAGEDRSINGWQYIAHISAFAGNLGLVEPFWKSMCCIGHTTDTS